MQEDNQITEDSLLQALSKIGAGRSRDRIKKENFERVSFSEGPGSGLSRTDAPSHSSSSGGGGYHMGGQNKRRRFVGDDSVVVERHALTRNQNKRSHRPFTASRTESERVPDMSTRGRGQIAGHSHSNRGAKGEDTQELYHLRQILRQEQAKLRETESNTQELRHKLRTAETRMAHYRLQVEELGRQLGIQQSETLRLRAELRQTREEQVSTHRVGNEGLLQEGRRRGRPRKIMSVPPVQNVMQREEPENDPQPVQWWAD